MKAECQCDDRVEIALQACLPLPAQLSLFDEWLPPLVELGVTLIQPVVYGRSEFDPAKTAARMDRRTRFGYKRTQFGYVAGFHPLRARGRWDRGSEGRRVYGVRARLHRQHGIKVLPIISTTSTPLLLAKS